MKEIDPQLLEEIWEVVSVYIPSKEKYYISIQLCKIFSDYGLNPEDFKDLLGIDKYLDKAIKEYIMDLDDYSEDY